MFRLLTHLNFLILILVIVNIFFIIINSHNYQFIWLQVCMSFLIYSLNFLCIKLHRKNMHAQLFCKRKKYLVCKKASSYFFSQTSCNKKKRLVGVGPNKMQQLDWLDLLVPRTPGLCFFFFFFFLYVFF